MYPNQFVAADAALNLSGFAKIYMAADPVDLRKGIDGYASIIQNSFRLSPFEDTAIFLFTNKSKNKIKALCYNGVGFSISVLGKANSNGRLQDPANTPPSPQSSFTGFWKFCPETSR